MRVLIAASLSLFLIVGTYFYVSFADSVRRQPVQLDFALDDANWKIELVRTFDCVPDPDLGSDALVIQLKGEDIYRRATALNAAETVVVEVTGEIEQGDNEIYIEANLATLDGFEFADKPQQHAMKVSIFRGLSLVAETSFWIEPGETSTAQLMPFTAPKPTSEHDH